MSDLARYESLLADWREKEEHAARMREFRDTGGIHRLKVAVVLADPVLASVVGPALNDLMDGPGWAKIVEMGVRAAEKEAERARHALESTARDAVIARASS